MNNRELDQHVNAMFEKQKFYKELFKREQIMGNNLFNAGFPEYFERILKKQKLWEDDGGTDFVFACVGSYEMPVECRGKGWPNCDGEESKCKSWKDKFLIDGGVDINERTLKNHIGERWIYTVAYPDFNMEVGEQRYAIITPEENNEYLLQYKKTQISCNSKRPQSVKGIPLEKFIPLEYFKI